MPLDEKGLFRLDKFRPKSNKGGKGKFTGCKTLRDAYKFYKQDLKSKGLTPIEYKKYAILIKDCNVSIKEYILDSGDDFRLPLMMGRLSIKKKDRVQYEGNKNRWPVDYKRSNELGFIVYFTTFYKYRWYWKKRSAVVRHKGLYMFIACRKAKRAIAKSVNVKKRDYYF